MTRRLRMQPISVSPEDWLEERIATGEIAECEGCALLIEVDVNDPDLPVDGIWCDECRARNEDRADTWAEDWARRAAWDAETSECFDAFADPWSWEQR